MQRTRLGPVSTPLSFKNKDSAFELIAAVRVDASTPNKPSEIGVFVGDYTFVYCQWYIKASSAGDLEIALTTNGTASDHDFIQMYGDNAGIEKSTQSAQGKINLIYTAPPSDGYGTMGWFTYAKPLGGSEGLVVGTSGGDAGGSHMRTTAWAGMYDELAGTKAMVRFFGCVSGATDFNAQLWGVRT